MSSSIFKYRKGLKYAAFLLAIGLGTWIFRNRVQQPITIGHPRDFTAIKASGIIHVATEYNKLSFYVDKDSIAGFNYELVMAFARDMKLRADIHPVMSEKERLRGLGNGTFDLIACSIPSTSEMKDSMLLSVPVFLNRQILVQRKSGTGKAPYLRNQLDLARKTLNVPQNSPAILRIRNLSNEIGDTIYIREVKKYGSEQLMYMVQHGDIDYAVCDEDIARTYASHLDKIDIHMAISFTQFYSWGMNKQSPILLKKLNTWLLKFKKTTKYQQIYQKYM